MKERLFYLWRMLNRIFIGFFVMLYLASISTNIVEHGFFAFFVTPEIILGRLFAGQFDPLGISIILFLISWVVGWIATGRHPWNIGS